MRTTRKFLVTTMAMFTAVVVAANSGELVKAAEVVRDDLLNTNELAVAAEPEFQVEHLRVQELTAGGEVLSESDSLMPGKEYLVLMDVKRTISEVAELRVEFSNVVIMAEAGSGLIRATLTQQGSAAVLPEAEADFLFKTSEDLALEYVPDSLRYVTSETELDLRSLTTVMKTAGDADEDLSVSILRLECDNGKNDGLTPGTWQTLSFRLKTSKVTEWQNKLEERNAEPLQITALGVMPAGKLAIYAPKIEDLWQLESVQSAGSMYVEPDWSKKALREAGDLLATELHLTLAVDLPGWVDELREASEANPTEAPYLTFDLAIGRDGLLKSVAQVATVDNSKTFSSPIEQSWQVDELKGLPLKALAATGWTTVDENEGNYAWSSDNSYSVLTGVWANVDQMQNLMMLPTQVTDDNGGVAGVLLSTRVDLVEFDSGRIYITYVL